MLVKTGKAERIFSALMAIVLCQMLQRPVLDLAASTAVRAGVALDGFVFLNRMSFLPRKC